jgi:adenine-specific DNA methylase
MIPRKCKRLAEVDFPIAVVSKHAAREKSIRHGHPSTLHLWWARRPLASCRAILLALLLPDPCDPNCPQDFKTEARDLLRPMPGRVGHRDEDLRDALLGFIGNFANWDNATSAAFLETARGIVKAAHPEETPLVVDPFAGGGSIPLEALRLGCETFATDLNPVACLILKTMLEDIPRYGPGLADELRRVGSHIKAAADKELSEFYPPDPDGAKPIAYLWARTVRCEAPNCGAEIPLMRSFWLCKKSSRKRALSHRVVATTGNPAEVEFEIFEPRAEKDVSPGTTTRAKAKCLGCGAVLSPERVRAQLAAQQGGADVLFDANGHRVGGARILAVVTVTPRNVGRQYRLPTEHDYAAVYRAQAHVAKIIRDWEQRGKKGLCPVPDETLPLMSGTFNVPLYGMRQWGTVFTARQKAALVTLVRLVSIVKGERDREAVSLAISKLSELACSICAWEPIAECTRHIFGRQAMPMAWDFGEGVLTSSSSGSFEVSLENAASGIEAIGSLDSAGTCQIADATNHPLPNETAAVCFTDPPYYFAVPYADLSDFFFVWLKRALPHHSLLRDPFNSGNTLTPKNQELCEMAHWDPVRYAHKDKEFFEEGMRRAFGESRRVLSKEGIGCIVFAHKTTEGWEALLAGIIRGGWTITGSWPIATEAANRLRARESAALQTSVHLICRPRTEELVGDWADVLRELPERVSEWMTRLEQEGVRGADLVFACIGPALEIFSRFSRVETPDGREVLLAEYLEKVWEVVGRAALHEVLSTAEAQARNDGAGALEEDARLTALFLWTIRSTAGNGADETTADGEEEEEVEDAGEEEGGSRKKAKGFTLIFDLVHRFALPLGIHLDVWKDRIIDIDKGVVRLLPVRDRARQLFGEAGAAGLADRIERAPDTARQLELFPGAHEPVVGQRRGKRRRFVVASAQAAVTEATTLDRVHTAMLLQASGRTNALRALLAAEQERGPDFVRLSNALSALYPQGSEEKRLLDAMLLAVPR